MGRPTKIVVSPLFSDSDIEARKGTWIEESDIKYPVIEENTDVYRLDANGREVLLLKFRKKQIKESLLKIGWDSYKDLAKASRGRGASAGPIDASSDYWKKRNLTGAKKWSTGYLNPVGNALKEEYDLLELQELRDKCQDQDIGIEDKGNSVLTKDELVFALVKKAGGVSKMKVNNQVASNPIGFFEAGKNFADLPCRLTHFTRTNYD
jgi:hypothetical protein